MKKFFSIKILAIIVSVVTLTSSLMAIRFYASFDKPEEPEVEVTDEVIQTASISGLWTFVSSIEDTHRPVKNQGSSLVHQGLIAEYNSSATYSSATKTVDGVANYEMALSKANLKDIFGWDGKSDMTFMSFVNYGNNWQSYMSDMFLNPEAAAALEEYSLTAGDESSVCPEIIDWFTVGTVDDVIPAVVRFTDTTLPGKSLNNLSSFGQKTINAQSPRTPYIDGVVDPGEYSGSIQLYSVNRGNEKNVGPYSVYVSHDSENIYFGITVDESARKTATGTPVAAPALDDKSGFMLYINFPRDFTARDANNYMILSVNYGQDGSDNPIAGVSATGNSHFFSNMDNGFYKVADFCRYFRGRSFDVDFVSNGTEFSKITIDKHGTALYYDDLCVWGGMWIGEAYKTLDFGITPNVVEREFYDLFISCVERTW